MLSFLDAFSGYHQIPMAPADEEKTAFITPHGLYCYKVMPFRLKKRRRHLSETDDKDLQALSWSHSGKVFHLLRRYNMKLNPSQCAFGVSAGQFLRFMVTQREIKVNPDQIKAVMEALALGAKGVAAPHRQTRCTGTVHSPIH
ncbi:hypothetical protein AAG906_007522 [Vitis piasezkii]